MSNLPTEAKVRRGGAVKILVDNSVIGKSITHETGWVDTGEKMWGDIPIKTGHAARIPVFHETDNSDVGRSVRYLPAIARLVKKDIVTLFSSSELGDETWTQPSGRYKGYGIYDYGIFSGIKIEEIIDPDYTMFLGSSWMNTPSLKEQKAQRFASKSDPLFLSLVEALGQKSNQDAYHIYTAEKSGCYCFLTMDFRLLRNLKSQWKNPAITGLKTKILSPEEYGILFGLKPISTRLLSYHNASYPVMPGANWPQSGRKPRNRKNREA
jgi:hypothetical protein